MRGVTTEANTGEAATGCRSQYSRGRAAESSSREVVVHADPKAAAEAEGLFVDLPVLPDLQTLAE